MDWLASLSFAQKQRLQFIEAMLLWDGSVQRSDVCKVFDVTPNHLTRDIKRYRTESKGALEYDVESRAYRPGRKFKPLLASGSAEEYLALLQAYSVSGSTSVLPAMGTIAHAETMEGPAGRVAPAVLREVMLAVRHGHGVTVSYQSLTEAEPTIRTLWPHTLVFTGERWHARAFDARRQDFRDFVLTRCSAPQPDDSVPPVPMTEDRLWGEREVVEVVPAPRLSPSQKAVVAAEFGMEGTKEFRWSREIRKCLVAYFLQRHRLEHGGSSGKSASPGQHPYLALKNPELAKSYRFQHD